MNRHFILFSLILALGLSGPAFGQFYLDIYPSESVANNETVVGTGVIQFSPGVGCGMCSSAYHTYQETEEIISPSGRTAYCTFDEGAPASSGFSHQCGATLDIGTDYGEYTAMDEPDVTCSELGNIVDTKIYLYLSWGITFSSTVGWPCDGPDCVQQPACTGGTVASCPLSVYYNTGGPCYLYVVTYWLVANGSCWSILGRNDSLITPTDGPGYCQ